MAIGDLLRIEHAGGTSRRLLRSSQGHPPDDDDDDDDDAGWQMMPGNKRVTRRSWQNSASDNTRNRDCRDIQRRINPSITPRRWLTLRMLVLALLASTHEANARRLIMRLCRNGARVGRACTVIKQGVDLQPVEGNSRRRPFRWLALASSAWWRRVMEAVIVTAARFNIAAPQVYTYYQRPPLICLLASFVSTRLVTGVTVCEQEPSCR